MEESDQGLKSYDSTYPFKSELQISNLVENSLLTENLTRILIAVSHEFSKVTITDTW